MSVIAKEMKFKVSLDVSGARADIDRQAAETEKAEKVATTRKERAQSGGSMAASFGRAVATGAAAVGTAWTIDKAFENMSPAFWSFMEGAAGKTWFDKMLKDYYGFDFKDIKREAFFNAQKAAQLRAEYVTAPLEAYGATKDVAFASAKLGKRAMQPEEIESVFREQYTLRKSIVQLDAAKDRMRLRYEMGAFGETARHAMESIKRQVSW